MTLRDDLTALLTETGLTADLDAAVADEHVRWADWTLYLAIQTGHAPTAAELDGVTNWMQRRIAEHSTSRPALALLAETGRTRKIRNIARHR